MKNVPLVLLVTLWIAWPLAARGGDGRIEINQTCAEKTGCLPGDTPGFPVRITSEGSYVLTSSLVVEADGVPAIEVSGSRVAIDLNGFTIRGAYQCGVFPPDCLSRTPAPGIDARDSSGVVVQGGSIQRFSGIGVDVGFHSHVEGVLIEVSGAGIRARSGSQILDNRLSNLRGDAIHIDFNDELLGDARVEGNAIRSARGDGIALSSGVVLRNYTTNVFGEDGNFGSGTAWGSNRFGSTPQGGRSLGDNVCGTNAC